MSNQVSTLSMSKEFKKTPIGEIPVEWEIRSIGEICEILDNKRVPLNSDERQSIKGDIPYYGANGVVDHINKFIFDEDLILIAEDGGYFEEYRTRPIAYRIRGKSWVNNHAHVLKPRDPGALGWVHYSLVHKNVIPYIKGGTRTKLNQNDLRAIPIPYPPPTEQKKIAEILSAVDDAIQKTEAVIEKMDLLLNQLIERLIYRGTTKPNDRLKKTTIGKVPTHWDVLPLQEVAVIERGKFQHRPRNEPRFYGGPYPFIQTGDITNAKGRTNRYSQTLNEEGLKISRLFPRGTILITIAANIGETAIAEFDVAFPDSIIGIITKDRIDNRYLEFYLRTRKTHLNGISTESAQKNINLETLRPYLIPLPPLDEQREIVNIISTVNHNLELEVGTANELGSMKQALMQMLLTGKVRVTVEV